MASAQEIIDKASIILQDKDHIRWPTSELLGWISDGQREIATFCPESNTVVGDITLAGGTRQSLPSAGICLIAIVRNTSPGSTNAIRLVDRAVMDAQIPDWHAPTTTGGTDKIQNYMFDRRSPALFYVYPSAKENVTVEAIYSKMPATFSTASATLEIKAQYHNALLDYTLYRAYLKDAEYTQNAERAQLHYQAYTAVITGKETVDASVEPSPAGSTRPGLGVSG